MDKANYKKILKRFWRAGLLVLVGLVFAAGTSYLNARTQSSDFIKWASPDETANYIFTKLYAQEGRLSIPERYNLLLKDIVHPRSFLADQGQLKPMSFLGMPLLYGTIAHFTSYRVIPYLTPLVGAIGLLFFYLLNRRVFDRDSALLASLFLAVFPVYGYYASRSMFHNILFLVALLVALYLLVEMNRGRQEPAKQLPWQLDYQGWLQAVLAGIFVALAVATRTSELLWLGPLLLLLWAANFKQTGLVKPLIVLLAAMIAYAPVLHWNAQLYGAVWHTGYPQMNNSIANIGETGSGLIKTQASGIWQRLANFAETLIHTVFYFGIKPRQSLRIFWQYLRLYSWLLPLASLGCAMWLTTLKRIKRRQVIYMIALVMVSAILIVYYGSWDFHDNPDASKITIGNSYTRYWLPVYTGLLPLAAMAIVRLSRYFKKTTLVWLVRSVAVVLVAILGIHQVWAGPDEGLSNLIKSNENSRRQWLTVLAHTERNAVVITRYHDKLLFPERKVILGLFDDDNMILEYAKMSKLLPTYYYNFTLPARDEQYLNRSRLRKFGLRIRLVEKVNNDFSLYKLEPDK